MKVKDLLEEIERCKKEYGEDFLEWDVYTEQISEIDKKYKRNEEEIKTDWEIITDSEGWEYFRCVGFWTKWPEKKIFTVNVNY